MIIFILKIMNREDVGRLVLVGCVGHGGGGGGGVGG
jgi:hypothetical protein